MNVLTQLTTLDILFIVLTIVIGVSWVYLAIILHRVAHMSRVADRFARTIEKFQDMFSIIDKIPTDIVRRVTDNLSHKK